MDYKKNSQSIIICPDILFPARTVCSKTLVLCPPLTDSIQQQNDFPNKPALDTYRSRWQQMSTPLQTAFFMDHQQVF